MSTRPLFQTNAIALLLATAALPALRAQAPVAPPPAQTAPAPTPTPVAPPPTQTAPAATPTAPAPAQTGPATAAPMPAQAGDGRLADKPASTEVTVKVEEGPKGVATKAKDAAGKDSVSVDFRDQDIRDILSNVADLFEINLVMPETLQGKQTIKLRDVTWRQIFQNVLAPVNYTYIEDGNIIKIVSNESLTQEPVITDVFIINYARASDILPTISSLVEAGAGGKIVVDARSNSLVITERPTRLGRIRPIIEQLDRATDQVMIETKFVEVTNSDVKNIGVNWSSLANYQLKAGNLSSTFDRSRGQTATNGTNTNNGTTATTTTGTTNTTTNTVTGAQTTSSNNTSTVTSNNGVPSTSSSTGSTGTISNGTNTNASTGTQNDSANTLSNTFSALSSLTNSDATNRALSAVFSASDFTLVLSALQTQQNSKIVSNPTVVTLNNTEAVINVGQERPIPKYAYNQQTGSFEVNGFDYKPIGIILRVTPQVNARGFIKLTVEPEVSQSTRDASFNGAQIPVVDTRKAKTQVSLKDGFTMGIGGLITTQTTKGGNKVPFLSAIPGIGRLFRSDSSNIDQTNLIIFITAKTISAEGGAVEQIFESGRVRQLEMTREDLPGYRDGSAPFLLSAKPGDPKPGEKAKKK
jgi:type II secretory pathway component GspD/PulD (secretin)